MALSRTPRFYRRSIEFYKQLKVLVGGDYLENSRELVSGGNNVISISAT